MGDPSWHRRKSDSVAPTDGGLALSYHRGRETYYGGVYAQVMLTIGQKLVISEKIPSIQPTSIQPPNWWCHCSIGLTADVFGWIPASHWMLVRVGRPQDWRQGQVSVQGLRQNTATSKSSPLSLCPTVEIEWVGWKKVRPEYVRGTDFFKWLDGLIIMIRFLAQNSLNPNLRAWTARNWKWTELNRENSNLHGNCDVS